MCCKETVIWTKSASRERGKQMSDCIINRKEAKHPQAVESASNRTENRQNIEVKC